MTEDEYKWLKQWATTLVFDIVEGGFGWTNFMFQITTFIHFIRMEYEGPIRKTYANNKEVKK